MGTRSRRRVAEGTQEPKPQKIPQGALIQPSAVVTAVGVAPEGHFGEDAEGVKSPALVLLRIESANGSFGFLLTPSHALSFAAQIAEKATELETPTNVVDLITPDTGLIIPGGRS